MVRSDVDKDKLPAVKEGGESEWNVCTAVSSSVFCQRISCLAPPLRIRTDKRRTGLQPRRQLRTHTSPPPCVIISHILLVLNRSHLWFFFFKKAKQLSTAFMLLVKMNSNPPFKSILNMSFLANPCLPSSATTAVKLFFSVFFSFLFTSFSCYEHLRRPNRSGCWRGLNVILYVFFLCLVENTTCLLINNSK